MRKRLGSGRKRRDRSPRRHDAARPISALRFLSGLAVTVALIFVFSHLAALHKLQTFVTDVRMRLNDPPEPSEVAVVRIDDDDYRTLFGARSPLDPAALERLLGAVAAQGPKVIGVDIDTSAPQFKEFRPGAGWPPVVWEREPKHIPESAHDEVEMLDVLGGRDKSLNAHSGLPLMVADPEDRVVRRYRREIRTSEGAFPTLPMALLERFKGSGARADGHADQRSGGHDRPQAHGGKEEHGEEPEDLFIRYAGDREGSHRTRLTAAEVLRMAEGGGAAAEAPLRDKIVLVGGAYLDQDVHLTPLGRMRGVDLMAHVVETELAGGGDRVPNHVTLILLELFEGAVVIVLFQFFHRFGFGRALLLNLLALLAVSVVCSVAAFHTPLRFTFFLPLLLCVLVYEFAVEYRIGLVKQLSKVFGGAAHGEAH